MDGFRDFLFKLGLYKMECSKMPVPHSDSPCNNLVRPTGGDYKASQVALYKASQLAHNSKKFPYFYSVKIWEKWHEAHRSENNEKKRAENTAIRPTIREIDGSYSFPVCLKYSYIFKS